MSKQLSLASINKSHSNEFSEQKKINLSNGDYILIDKKFKPTSIQRYLLDYMDILDELKKNKTIDSNVVRDVTFINYMLLLRHFTSLNNIPKDLQKIVIVCEKLIDLGILEEIMTAFDQSEVEKINEQTKKVAENSDLIGKQIGDLFVRGVINEMKQEEDVKENGEQNIQES